MHNPARHILTARGVTSEVPAHGEQVAPGHVLLMDYDDETTHTRVLDESKQLPGVTAIFESSPHKYHVWNATVRSRRDAALAMLERKVDPMHISIGFRRGRWTIRCGPKNQINASEGPDVAELENPYKTEPKPLQVWVNECDQRQSLAHVRMIDARFEQDVEAIARERCPDDLAGDAFRLEHYISLTDELKAAMDDSDG